MIGTRYIPTHLVAVLGAGYTSGVLFRAVRTAWYGYRRSGRGGILIASTGCYAYSMALT